MSQKNFERKSSSFSRILFAMLLFISVFNSLSGQDLSGKRITVVKPEAYFKLGEEIKWHSYLGENYEVERVKGDWLFVKNKKSYVHRDDVVLYDEAPIFFSNRIEANPTAANYYDRGGMWVNRNDLKHAVSDYTEAIRLDRSNSEYVKSRGYARLRIGEYDNAIDDFDKVLLQSEDASKSVFSYSALFGRSDAFLAKGEVEKALLDLNVLLNRTPEAPFLKCRHALAICISGNFEGAINDCRMILKENPGHPNVLKDFAWILATCPDDSLRDGKLAVQYATVLLDSAQGKSPESLDVLAAAYAEAGDFKEAVAVQKKAMELAPESLGWALIHSQQSERLKLYQNSQPLRDSRMIHGVVQTLVKEAAKSFEKDDLANAKECCRRILVYEPGRVSSLLMRATIAHIEKDFQSAIEGFTKALEHEPQRKVDILIARCGVYRDSGEYDKALSDLNLALEIAPKSLLSLGERAATYSAMRDYDSAIVDCTVAIHLATTDLDRSIYHHQRGHLWQDSGEDSAAVADYAQAARFHLEDGNSWNSAAWILATSPIEEIRNGEMAIQYALKACEATEDPHDVFLDTLAAAYAAAGEYQFAFEIQNKAIDKLGDSGDESLAKEYKQRRALYAAKKPFLRNSASKDSTQPNPLVEPVAPSADPAATSEAK